MDRCLISVANSGHELTRAIYRQGSSIDTLRFDSLVDVYGRRARLTPSDLRTIVGTAGKETHRTMAVFQIPMSRLLLESQAESAKRIADSSGVFPAGALRELEAGVQSASRLLVDGDFELNDVIQSLLDQVARIGFDHVVFALVNEDRSWIQGRMGSAGATGEFVSRFRLHLGSDTPAAWEKPDDQLVGRADPAVAAPVSEPQPGAFCLMPIIIEGAVGGCLYADRTSPAPGIEAVRWAMARTRDVIARAIRRKASRRN